MFIKFNGFDFVEGGVCAAKGFTASGIHSGIRKNKEKADLALISCEVPCNAGAIYTQNKVKGAPLTVTKGKSFKRQGAGGDLQQWKRQHL